MKELIFEIEEVPEGGFVARAFGESIFVEADTYEELQDKIPDAVLCHFEDDELPRVIRLEGKCCIRPLNDDEL